MNPIDLERLVRRGAASLAESTHLYWPSSGNNQIPERNISLHLGHVLLEAGFGVYAEAHTDTQTNIHVDLLAIHPAARVLVAAEFKRLYNADQVLSLARDVPKLKAFRAQQSPSRRHPGLELDKQYGLLAGTTWNDEYARWFTSNTSTTEDDPTGGALEGILGELPKSQTSWGACVLASYYDAFKKLQLTHWFVYALFPLSSVVAGSTI